jgi:hypothetical protein
MGLGSAARNRKFESISLQRRVRVSRDFALSRRKAGLPGDHPDEVVSRLAPIGHKHINMRGILTFDLARYRSSLLRQPLSGAEDRVSS